MRYEGKTVVITGVGREGQVGEAIAQAFAAEGAALVLVDRLAGEVEARAAALRDWMRETHGSAAGPRIIAHACDLTDTVQVQRVATAVGASVNGGLDALVCVAGGFAMSGPVAESDLTVLDRQFAINLKTAYITGRHFVPLLRPAQGAAVFFASAAVLPGGSVAGKSAYAAAKAGVLTLVQAIAEEERVHGVRANAIAPTQIRTVDNVKSMGDAQVYVDRESIADVTLFLCSAASRNVSGQVLRLA